ncbi:hypothetical protein RYX36_028016 [Vicia faba]
MAPISPATTDTTSALNNLLTVPWSASQTRGLTFSGSDVRVGNLFESRGRAYQVLKLYNSHEGTGKSAIKVPPHTIAGYATVATSTKDDIKRKERNSGLRNQGIKTKREQLLKVTAAVPLLLVYPNAIHGTPVTASCHFSNTSFTIFHLINFYFVLIELIGDVLC